MRHADEVLEDESLISTVYEGLASRRPRSKTFGRRGVPAEVVLRMLLLKHVREAIPLLVRIRQVVDVYDALRIECPDKTAHTHQQAMETMRAEAESGLWDGAIVAEFSMLALREHAAST